MMHKAPLSSDQQEAVWTLFLETNDTLPSMLQEIGCGDGAFRKVVHEKAYELGVPRLSHRVNTATTFREMVRKHLGLSGPQGRIPPPPTTAIEAVKLAEYESLSKEYPSTLHLPTYGDLDQENRKLKAEIGSLKFTLGKIATSLRYLDEVRKNYHG